MKYINEKIMRYVIPFTYSISFEDAVSKIDNGESGSIRFERDVFDRAQGPESDIYEYIRNEFRYSEPTNRNKLGCSFKACRDKNVPLLQLVSDDMLFSDSKIGKRDIFNLGELGIILGRNGVGFIWYEFNLGDNGNEKIDVDAFILFQNQFKELCRNDQKVKFWKKTNVTEKNKNIVEKIKTGIKEEKVVNEKAIVTYYEPFSLGIWTAEIVDFLSVRFTPERKNPIKGIYKNVQKKDTSIIKRNGYTYELIVADEEIEESAIKYIPDKSLLFSYCCFEEMNGQVIDCDAINKLIYIANGYKSSYLIKDSAINDVLLPFSNVAWYVSQEGCACIALPEESNSTFMRTELLSKIRVDYFALYMKCLFQSYSLLKYAERIQEELSAVKADYIDDAEENTVEDLIGSINLFLAKSMATSVSHINHQSEFYIYLKNRLHIHEDVKSVTAGLEALSELQKEKIQEKESEKSDRIQAVMGLFSVLAISSALLDTSDLLEKIIPNWDFYDVLVGHPIYALIYIVVFLFTIGISAIAAVYAFKAIKATKRKKSTGTNCEKGDK